MVWSQLGSALRPRKECSASKVSLRILRALRQMEREGLVSSCWETSVTGPVRRTYTPTDVGWRWLHVWAAAIAESRLLLSSYLQRYEALTSSDEQREALLAGTVGAARP